MAHFHNPNLAGAGGQGGYQIERSLRFNRPDSAYLNRTPASAGNRRTWTWSGWVKRSVLGVHSTLFHAYDGSSSRRAQFYFNTSNQFEMNQGGGGTTAIGTTTAVFRDTSAWYHILFYADYTNTTFKLYVNNVEQTISYSSSVINADGQINAAIAHQIGGDDGSGAYFPGYMAEIHFIDGQALTPSSFGETNSATGVWQPKKYTGSYGTNGFYLKFAQNSIGVDLTSTATITAPFGGTAENARVSDSVYLISNTTTGSAFTLVQEDFGSVKQLSRYYIAAMYFTGGTSTFELQYSTNGSSWTTAASLSITASGQNFSGNINVNARYVRLQATAFGVNGQGGIDSLIIYQDPLGVDSSPNSNNWNVNNFSIVAGAGNDSLIDTPTPYADGGNGRGNYCTLNSLEGVNSAGSNLGTFANGNLEYSVAASVGNAPRMLAFSTIHFPTSGKWYAEFTNISNRAVGLLFGSVNQVGLPLIKYISVGSSNYYSNDGSVTSGAAVALITTDIVGVTYDVNAATIKFYKNGTEFLAFGSVTTSIDYCFGSHQESSASAGTVIANFGQRPFAYTPPSGFLALNTQNLPEPTIKKPSSYMDVKLYTGNSSTQTISGLGFSPDLVWIKSRNNAYNHGLQDAVRGAGKTLYSNLTNAEDTQTSVTAFNSDGFSLANDSWNQSAVTYAAWCWDANGAGSTNTAGSITSTVSANATAGFSIVSATAPSSYISFSFGHGLGVKPAMVIYKERTGTASWWVWHQGLPNAATGRALNLNSTSAEINGTYWGTIDSSVVTSNATQTTLSAPFVAYCFSEVAGFSKFGSYTGNGSTDGVFVHCGFRPKLLIWKRTDSSANWFILDAARNTYNVVDKEMYPDQSAAESTFTDVDFLSNGFKLRASAADRNGSGATFIFAAWAESPAKYSLAR